MDQKWLLFRFAAMMDGADIFIIWLLIRSIRGSAWGGVWFRNVSTGCANSEFSGRSSWWQTTIRAGASFGCAAAGKNCRVRSRWERMSRPTVSLDEERRLSFAERPAFRPSRNGEATAEPLLIYDLRRLEFTE